MNNRPKIGLLLDFAASGSFSSRPHYALRTLYFEAIWRAGGLPIAVPYIADAIDSYLQLCSGMILPGGFYPFPAHLYGRMPVEEDTVHPRFAYEIRLLDGILQKNIPVLGVCAGMQAIAGSQGATLYNNIREETDSTLDHLNGNPAEQTAHGVRIIEGSLLHRIVQSATLQVNTAHNESLKTVPDGVIVNAVADDGIVEGIELPGQRFCLGVQWHPEFFAVPGNPHFWLFEALVAAASESDRAPS